MPFNIRSIRNVTSLIGVFLATVGALLFLIVFMADLFGLHSNPYQGIVFFLVLPAIFVLGLVLIPIGTWVERRRRRGMTPAVEHWSRIDLSDPVQRRAVAIFAVLTLANVVIVSLAAYRGVEYMDTPQFCGAVCHTVMKPEFVAYQDQPHS